MKTGQSVLKSRWYQVVTGILSLTVLGINLMMVSIVTKGIDEDLDPVADIVSINYSKLRMIFMGLLLAVILLHLSQCFAFYMESKILFFKHLIYILFSACGIVAVFRKGDNAAVWPAVCFLYLAAVLTGCLLSIVQKRSKWNILVFIITLVVTIMGGFLVLTPGLIDPAEMPGIESTCSLFAITIVFFMLDVQGVAMIMPLAFSSIRMDILKKIIRKTYAVEILLGIILLIMAFSFILPAFEPGISNYWDALWYCFAIVTTIGFGDLYATSGIGRVMSVILGLYGIIVVSLITSIIVNFYGEMKKEEGSEEEGTGEEDSEEEGAGEEGSEEEGAGEEGSGEDDFGGERSGKETSGRGTSDEKGADRKRPDRRKAARADKKKPDKERPDKAEAQRKRPDRERPGRAGAHRKRPEETGLSGEDIAGSGRGRKAPDGERPDPAAGKRRESSVVLEEIEL